MIVSPLKGKKIVNYYYEKDKIRSILAEVLLRYLLENKFSLTQAEIIFKYGNYGKPHLQQKKETIFFNISHSGSWVLCGIGNSVIGIDVEEIKKNDLSFAKDVLSKKEYELWKKQSPECKIQDFYTLWTLKESYLKYTGKGISIPFESLTFHISTYNVLLEAKGQIDNTCCFLLNMINDRYRVALCVDKNQDVIPEIQILKLDELLKWKPHINKISMIN